MDYLTNPSRDELMQRHIRDSAVHQAVLTHRANLGETEERLVAEIARLAVHNALTQYAATIKMDIARIESFDRMRADEAMLRPDQLAFRGR